MFLLGFIIWASSWVIALNLQRYAHNVKMFYEIDKSALLNLSISKSQKIGNLDQCPIDKLTLAKDIFTFKFHQFRRFFPTGSATLAT